MTLYLVAGGWGSGKSTVAAALRARNQKVVDADKDPLLSGFVENSTGRRVSELPALPYPREWLKNHSWLWDSARLTQLAEENSGQHVFVCGFSNNAHELYSFFQRRFWLWVDSDVAVGRLRVREPERWNNGSFELDKFLRHNAGSRSWAIKEGFTILFGAMRPEEIVDDVLAYVAMNSMAS